MDVLGEILRWSVDRPDWQRDALRRLLVNGELTETDIVELTALCKEAHGLAEAGTSHPLTQEQFPKGTDERDRVTLKSIYHHKGVNALAEGQTVNFGSNLTVIYGDNAAGKSGYTRILKEACRARGSEKILGNVLSGVTPIIPTVAIRYRVGNSDASSEWTGKEEDHAITRVSVFDTHAATVYLNEKTDVAFRPFGLDLFDKLVRACLSVRRLIETEEQAHKTSLTLNLEFPEGTTAAKSVNGITSLTDPEKVKAYATVTADDEMQLILLEKQLNDLQTNDPAKLVKELTLRENRFRSFSNQLQAVDAALSVENVEQLFAFQEDTKDKAKIAKAIQEATFPTNLIEGTGSEKWRDLWEAARIFSNEAAYINQSFPVTTEEARCLLCQQTLDHNAADRLRNFESFIQSAAEREFKNAREAYAVSYKKLDTFVVMPEFAEAMINEVRVENETLAEEIKYSLIAAEARRSDVFLGLNDKAGLPKNLPAYESCKALVDSLIEQLKTRAVELSKETKPGSLVKIREELDELRARKKLHENLATVIAEIDRKKKIAAYGLCLKDTNFQGITAKSGALTKEVVTKQLQQSFSDELEKLRFKHVEVELQEAGGVQGTFYHKIVLKRAPGINVPKVVSEGEARCLSIAAFFAELSTADEESAIIFDDPVSSLDYKWRAQVAARLVEEAKTRQVIVFTHDIVFLLALRQLADQKTVPKLDQHIRQLPQIGAGVCKEELPWVAMPVKKKIGFIKKSWEAANKLYKEGHQDAYETEAGTIYGFLREAWERALEEVLLGGVVERYRKNIQSQQIAKIADITLQDCKELEDGMTKSSSWLIGHDQAPAAKADMPEPTELNADIAVLEDWVKRINQRRKV